LVEEFHNVPELGLTAKSCQAACEHSLGVVNLDPDGGHPLFFVF
jgi:hypothetical protein